MKKLLVDLSASERSDALRALPQELTSDERKALLAVLRDMAAAEREAKAKAPKPLAEESPIGLVRRLASTVGKAIRVAADITDKAVKQKAFSEKAAAKIAAVRDALAPLAVLDYKAAKDAARLAKDALPENGKAPTAFNVNSMRGAGNALNRLVNILLDKAARDGGLELKEKKAVKEAVEKAA